MGKRLIIIGAAIFAALFLFSSIMLFSEYQDQKQSARVFKQVTELVEKDFTESEQKKSPFEKYAAVYEKNHDLIGWITIEGTRIDYPVMQTKEKPNFYLKHAFDKSYSRYGVPYIAENCDIDVSDNIVIYGHHMNNGSMFSDLCRYADEDFLIIILLMQAVNLLLMNMFQNAQNFLCTIPARLLNMEIN